MSIGSESTTEGLVSAKLRETEGYPSERNITLNDITWFIKGSYKNTEFDWIDKTLSIAGKNQKQLNKGTPDFVITKRDSNTIVIIECKSDTSKHSSLSDMEHFSLLGFGTSEETKNYAVNGALWYASFLCDIFDVIAIGVSGQNDVDSRVTSFVWPKNGQIEDIVLIEDDNLTNALVSIDSYEKDIESKLNRNLKTDLEIRSELRRYALSCANFLRANGIEDNSKAGFISAVILGLTNTESNLYKFTKQAIDSKNSAKSKKLSSDLLGRNSVKMLKASLYGEGTEFEPDYIKGVWEIDGIPKGKRTALKKFYDILLSKDELLFAAKGDNKDFPYGDTVLSRCIYSIYENVTLVLEKYRNIHGIDIMGEFYTTFLRYTKGNAKEKGIVLTPKHITELFCDICEYYSGKRFDENTKIIDICCGSGTFLITALSRIRHNISCQSISVSEKSQKYTTARDNCLIGVEKESSMYALAYANMRFHGNGIFNLFNCSSLLIDSYAPIDDSGKTYLNQSKIPLHEAIQSFGEIDVAMINPPYSLEKRDNSSAREYPIIKKQNEIKENIKLLKKEKTQQKKAGADNNVLEALDKKISKLENDFNKHELNMKNNKLDEVVFSKGQDELDFIAAMLHYLKDGGIGVAIVPMSCAGNSGQKLRQKILKHHTLIACMTMPPRLFFDSHVDTATCIMVFRAHHKHDENKSVFFARWQDDGFKVIPHNGRKDAGRWNEIRKSWLDQIDGTAPSDNRVWLKKKIGIKDEALAEAYIETDYTQLSDKDFEITLKKYSLYKYMEENGYLEE